MVNEIGHIAYQSIRLAETNVLTPCHVSNSFGSFQKNRRLEMELATNHSDELAREYVELKDKLEQEEEKRGRIAMLL